MILPAHDCVTVLMAVRNGAQTLPAQLDSLAAQSHANWRLIASDDGSTDGSRAILQRFAQGRVTLGQVAVVEGPGQGFVANFLSLLARPGVSGPVALSDQDDIWFPDKLQRALARLATLPAGKPALYCSRRVNWWPDQDRRRLSRPFPRTPSFANALVENIAPGNTIVLNAAALDLARATAKAADGVPFHDWWLYLLVSGAGGVVLHDPVPGLLYRQHARNVLGEGEGLLAGIKVKEGVLRGAYATRIGQNLQALQQIEDRLTPQNLTRLKVFQAARNAGLWHRLALMWRAGVYRQRLLANLGLWGAVCFGRV